jgi:acetolactate decarboxylase
MRSKIQCLLLGFVAICIVNTISMNAQEVRVSGASRNVMMGLNLSAHMRLDTLLFNESLFGLGPVDSLQGEITILKGIPYVSTIINGNISTRVDSNLMAPFFVYSYCKEWIERSFHFKGNFKDLEQFLSSNSDHSRPYPFRIIGIFRQVDYHIIMKDWSNPIHNHEIHYQSKVSFSESDMEGEIVGFFSKSHEGIFTHKGDYIHIHLVRQNPALSAHIDQIEFDGEVILYLPK